MHGIKIWDIGLEFFVTSKGPMNCFVSVFPTYNRKYERDSSNDCSLLGHNVSIHWPQSVARLCGYHVERYPEFPGLDASSLQRQPGLCRILKVQQAEELIALDGAEENARNDFSFEGKREGAFSAKMCHGWALETV